MATILDPESNPVDRITQSLEWQQTDNNGRLAIMDLYYDAIENEADTNYQGGFKQYQKDHKDLLDYLEDRQRLVFADESQKIVKQSRQAESDYWRQPAGDNASWLEESMATVMRGNLYFGASLAKAMGYEQTAKSLNYDARHIEDKFNEIGDHYARKALKGGVGTQAIYEFARNFVPGVRSIFEAHDKELLAALAKQEADTPGGVFNPINVARITGHFGGTLALMWAMPGFGAVKALKGFKAINSYALYYMTASSIRQGLDVPIHQNSISKMAGYSAGVYASMLAGGSAAHYFTKLPYMRTFMAKLPNILSEFIGGRIADVGESVANGVEMAIRTGDLGEIIRTFPIALGTNMAEEMIVDIVGAFIPGRIRSRKLQNQKVKALEQVEQGLRDKLEMARTAEDRRSIGAMITKVQAAKKKVAADYSADIKEELKDPNSITSRNKDQILNEVSKGVQAGQSKEAALEAAVGPLYVDTDAMSEQVQAEIDKQDEMVFNTLEKVQAEAQRAEDAAAKEAAGLADEIGREPGGIDLATIAKQARKGKRVAKETVTKKVKKSGYISYEGAKRAGWDVQAMRENNRLDRAVLRVKGRAPGDMAEGFISEGGYFSKWDNPSQNLYDELMSEAQGGVAASQIAEMSSRDAEIMWAEYQAQEMYVVTDSFTGGGLEALIAWRDSLPQSMRNAITITPEGHIVVNEAAYEAEYDRKYSGEKIAGKVSIINGQVFVQMAFGAPTIAGHHEIYHLAEALSLANSEIELLQKEFGNAGARADAYANYMLRQNNQGVIGRIFSKIKGFFDGIKNYFAGRGFTSPSQIFDRIGQGKLQLIRRGAELQEYYATYVSKGFLTADGFKEVLSSHRTEYPNAMKENLVHKGTIAGQVNYSVGDLTDDRKDWIESDLETYGPGTDYEVVIDIPTDTWVFSLAGHQERGFDIRRSMEQADYHRAKEIPQQVAEMYAVEEKNITEDSREQGWYGNLLTNVAKIPGLRWVRLDFTSKEEMNFLEEAIDMPSEMREKYKSIDRIVVSQNERGISRTKRIEYMDKRLEAVNRLDKQEEVRVGALLRDGGINEEEYSAAELGDKGKGYSPVEIEAYLAIRQESDLKISEELDDVKKQIVNKMAALKEITLNGGNEEYAKDLEDTIRELVASAKNLESLFGKGYFPHTFANSQAERIIGFDLTEKNINPEIIDALVTYEDMLGIDHIWSEMAEDLTLRPEQRKYPNKKTLEFILPFVGGIQGRSRYGKMWNTLTGIGMTKGTHRFFGKNVAASSAADKNLFNPEMRRIEAKAILDRLLEVVDNRTEQGKAIQERLKHQWNVLQKQTGWAASLLSRKGALGYDIEDPIASFKSYFMRHAGYKTKAVAGGEMYDILSNIPAKGREREYRYAKRLVKHLLHNSDRLDKISNRVTSFFFMKHLAFDAGFVIKNTFQNWTKGIPVLMASDILIKKFGKVALPFKAMKAIAKAQGKVHFRLYGRFWKGFKITEAEKLIKKLNLSDEVNSALVHAIQNLGLLSVDIQSEMFKDLGKSKTGNRIIDGAHYLYAGLMDWSGRFVGTSDKTNRVISFLASYDLLTQGTEIGKGDFDDVAASEAAKLTLGINVDYSGWNTPPTFWSDSPLRATKPAFVFKRFQWHFVRKQIRWILEGKLGPIVAMNMLTVLFGGAATLPFWKKIKEWFGLENTAAQLRLDVVDHLGGHKTILQLVDQGLFGLAGFDMSYQLGLKPLTLADPLMGENAIMAGIRDLRNTKDDILRGRIMKALFEGIHSPGFVKDIHRAIRTSQEGVTTFRGDVVLDLKGKPFRMNAYEIGLYSMGLIPRRLGRHYASQRAVRELRSHWGRKKSRLGTKYKIAILNGDSDEISDVKREIEFFNRDVSENQVGGEYPTSPISASTVRNWARGSDTATMRAMARALEGESL